MADFDKNLIYFYLGWGCVLTCEWMGMSKVSFRCVNDRWLSQIILVRVGQYQLFQINLIRATIIFTDIWHFFRYQYQYCDIIIQDFSVTYHLHSKNTLYGPLTLNKKHTALATVIRLQFCDTSFKLNATAHTQTEKHWFSALKQPSNIHCK